MLDYLMLFLFIIIVIIISISDIYFLLHLLSAPNSVT